jgi:hypothetical protein
MSGSTVTFSSLVNDLSTKFDEERDLKAVTEAVRLFNSISWRSLEDNNIHLAGLVTKVTNAGDGYQLQYRWN